MADDNLVIVEAQLRARIQYIERIGNAGGFKVRRSDVESCAKNIMKLNGLIDKYYSDLDDLLYAIEHGSGIAYAEYEEELNAYNKAIMDLIKLFSSNIGRIKLGVTKNPFDLSEVTSVYHNILRIVDTIKGDLPEEDVFRALITLLRDTNVISNSVFLYMVDVYGTTHQDQ